MRAGRSDIAWLAAMSAVLLLALLSFSSYAASLPFIREEWGLTNAQSGVVFSAYLAGYAVSSLALVPLTDRFPPFRILVAGVSLTAAGGLLFPLLADGPWTGSALRFIAGAGHVGVYITGIQLVASRFPEGGRGAAVGLFVGAGYAGTTISYVLMGALLSWMDGWEAAYLATALPGLAAVLLAALLASGRGEEPPSQSSPAEPGEEVEKRKEREARGSGRLTLSALRDRRIALVIGAYALHTAELYLARLWLPLLLGASLVRSGYDAVEAVSLAAALAGFMFMTGTGSVLAGGWLSDRLGRPTAAALIFSASGACSFAAGWLVGLPPAYLVALGFVYGFVTAADSAIYSTAVTELAPRGRVGSTQAVQSFVGFGIGAAAPVLAGSILDASGSTMAWGLVFSFNGALAVIGVVFLVWLRRLNTEKSSC